MISIIDYGMGNLRSVQKAFERVGASAKIVTSADDIRCADRLILPGVGAFADAARTLRDQKLIEPIHEFVATGKPFLGICLGMQLLFDVSYEDGEHTGLKIVPGKVVPFEFDNTGVEKLKVPHMGWNQIYWDQPIDLLNGVEQGDYVYFVHSYYVVCDRAAVKTVTCDYGDRFTCMIARDNVYGVQFHPEKSQQIGLKILENFSAI